MQSVETLIVTMHMNDSERLLKRMNIQTDFIIGNQAGSDLREKINYNEYNGIILTRDEVGVGRNRNTVLQNATGDICVLADDDMIFIDDYPEIVLNCFSENTDADVIIFNLLGMQAYEGERTNKKRKTVNLCNYMNYGAARIAFRRKPILYKGISFNVNFGGGTDHQCGEDSLFLRACLNAGLKVVAVENSIASIANDRSSTWFKGYTDKYFFDKGVFLQVAHPYLSNIFAIYLVLRHHEYIENNGSRKDILKRIQKGIEYVRKGY